ncbi:MAG TPA: heme-dependent oxidative N-demethylase subunit alpha family protein [Ramlibacter sp.]|uniref:heme-dependent oxidative N-demethylase subunit alpha family protein n=1 Tax=Ramlibacter sp. TaxID=1917967 RepID=UPI002D7F8F7A|nr:heme-dependent oxidative N-demethylase subunit alpha family protein [Ramlibacter sp.]HET8747484.1 heme-dependent oxidative N-demethylase subunit alpha family protein [Ramlibacter sp.]
MDFDLSRIAVPFRMQPGLQRLGAGARQLTPLAAGSPLWQEKKAVLEAGASRLCVPGFDAQPALRAIAAQAAREGLAAEGPPELAFEEDFAVLEGTGGTLPWLCVCVPSHWAPEEKLGLPFAAVHAPVADKQLLLAAGAQLVQLVTSGERFERFVWTVTPSGRFDQHPRRHPRAPWPATDDPAAFAQQCFLRVERQTFFPVDEAPGQAVFTIRVQLQPLAEAMAAPQDAQRLHDALASMSEAVLAYKNLAPARERLLAWLARPER